MRKSVFLVVLLAIAGVAYSQTVTYSTGNFTYTMTPCTKAKALSNAEFFMESKLFYHFDIYQFDYQNALKFARIQSGTDTDFKKVYNGFSYGTISIGYRQVNCIMYCNSKTGQYSLLQFADFDLGGGTVHQNLKKIFEKSIGQVDNK